MRVNKHESCPQKTTNHKKTVHSAGGLLVRAFIVHALIDFVVLDRVDFGNMHVYVCMCMHVHIVAEAWK
jgi:hypothetical protein